MNTINEYDLQFGLLALRMFFVDGARLVAAINEWENRNDAELSDVLMELGAMDADQCAMIASMIPDQIAAEPPSSVPEIAATAPAPAPPADQSVMPIQAVVADQSVVPVQAGGDPQPPRPIHRPQSPEVSTIDRSGDSTLPTLGANRTQGSSPSPQGSDHRFRIKHPLAKGALGEVFIARDGDLNREVALKQMLDHCADDPGTRARFVFEAEVTGALEHPGVVPIYALGSNPNGRPYYAMRFIEGQTLEASIDAFHSAGGIGKNAIASLEFRELLGQLISICKTMAYAHSRGIIHRDIKPANVMLGKFGETLVVDWGLAKVVGSTDQMLETSDTDLDDAASTAGVADTSHADTAGVAGTQSTDQTQLGQACGTPQFMSPEQAIGRHDVVDARSDIYSLGATLYRILTGQNAFAGGNVGEVLSAVRVGQFAKPRQVNPQVPKPLQAICLRAMSTDPGARYAAATDIADDLAAWLADQPVGALRERLPVRARRWMRRHRSVVGSMTLAGCLVFAVLVTSVAMLTKAYQTAEKNRQQAHATVNDFFTTVSEETLLKMPGMENLRTQLLQQALSYYQGFLADKQRGSLQREIGLTNYYAGRIVEDVQSPSEARPLYRTAEQSQRKLISKNAGDASLKAELASTLNAIGRTYDKQEETTRSVKQFKASIDLRKEIAALSPENVEFQRTYANSLMNLGLAFEQRGEYSDAIKYMQQAQALRRDSLAKQPEERQLSRDLAKGNYNLALVELTEQNFDAAQSRLAEAAQILERVIDSGSDSLEDYRSLAITKLALAAVQQDAGDFDAAEGTLQETILAFERLLFQIPGVSQCQYSIGTCYLSLGDAAPNPHDGINALKHARSILTRLIDLAPRGVQYTERLKELEEIMSARNEEILRKGD